MTVDDRKHVLVLQHVPWEGPGILGDVLTAQDVPMRHRIIVDDPDPQLPPVDELLGLVVMGGPMNADDDDAHPGLRAEREYLKAAVDAAVPVIGICLGAQLLARAHGAHVHRGVVNEIGFRPIEILTEDPVLAELGGRGDTVDVLHWHSDVADLPPGAELLARSEVTPNQAFRIGTTAYGFQFHIEMGPHLLVSWLQAPPVAEELSEADIDVLDLARAADATLPGLVPKARAALQRWAR